MEFQNITNSDESPYECETCGNRTQRESICQETFVSFLTCSDDCLKAAVEDVFETRVTLVSS